jgi:hypothetical protein
MKKAVAGKDSFYASAVVDKQKNELLIQAGKYFFKTEKIIELNLNDIKLAKADAVLETLAANDLYSLINYQSSIN